MEKKADNNGWIRWEAPCEWCGGSGVADSTTPEGKREYLCTACNGTGDRSERNEPRGDR